MTSSVTCPRVRADLHMANDLVPNSGDVILKIRCHIQSVDKLILVLGTCEILIAIVHSARGLNIAIFPVTTFT